LIKVGETIYLELKENEEETKRLRSKVLDSEEGRLFIDFPVEEVNSKPRYFLEGTQFRAIFLGENHIVYLFETEVLGKTERKVPMLVIKDPGQEQYIKIQRREYVRIDSNVDCAVYSPDNRFEPFTTVTSDLSGGGMALVLPSSHELSADDHVKTWLALGYQSGETHFVAVKAKFIREYNEQERNIGSFQFLEIEESDRQKIIRFCFEQQLELKRRKKLS
jgi:c-di-GMP-binding flagellar brake protein YcgR